MLLILQIEPFKTELKFIFEFKFQIVFWLRRSTVKVKIVTKKEIQLRFLILYYKPNNTYDADDIISTSGRNKQMIVVL